MRVAHAALVALVALLTYPSVGYAQTTIIGTGSAFAAPIYTKWAQEAKASTDVQLNYQATGSGVGQKQVVAGTVDFGASDVPMEASKLLEANILQFPTVVGGLDVVINLPNVGPNALRLTGPVLADIYMGNITQWNDPRIAKLNPDISLPGIVIVPIHHATASGSTFALSRYLAKVSETWKTRMGVGLTLDWPGGMGVHGSLGTSGDVPRFAGSIGYAESSYATRNNLTTVQLLNKSGKYVAPTAEAFAAAVASNDWTASNFAVDLTDMPGDQSWPLVTATFALVPKNPDKVVSSAAVLKFYSWAFDHGDEAAISLEYVPLPRNVKEAIKATWNK